MLELITKSKIRQKLLLLFVYNPSKEYYINEAARLVGTSSGTAQRELNKLAASGILKKERRANLSYFKADTKSPIYRDVQNIVKKTIGIEHQLKAALARIAKIDFAFLFGSYVKGDFRPNSDIDLYVIGEVKEDDVYRAIKKAEEKIGREINYHLASVREFKKNSRKSFFYQEILRDYSLINGDDAEFRKFIKTA